MNKVKTEDGEQRNDASGCTHLLEGCERARQAARKRLCASVDADAQGGETNEPSLCSRAKGRVHP